MSDWRYFKIRPDYNAGHLPANRELVGMRTGYPEDQRYEIYRYPLATTIFLSLSMDSYTTYDDAREGRYYEGTAA